MGDGRRRGSRSETRAFWRRNALARQRAINVPFRKGWNTSARGRYAAAWHPLTIAGPDWFDRHSKAFLSSIGQATGTRMVLRCMVASLGMIASACAAVADDELPSSPPRIRKGWPLTMSWPVPWTIWMCGNSAVCSEGVERKRQATPKSKARKPIFKGETPRR